MTIYPKTIFGEMMKSRATTFTIAKLGGWLRHGLIRVLMIAAFFSPMLVYADSANDTPLCEWSLEAYGLPHSEIAAFFEIVKRCPSAKISDSNGWTDMHWAAALDLPDMIRIFSELGHDIDVIMKADERQFPDHLKEGIQGARASMEAPLRDGVEVYASFGYSPVHWAAWNNSTAAAAMIFSLGGNLNARTSSDVVPLHLAVYANAFEVAKLLAKAGADTNASNDDGAAPLHWTTQQDAADLAVLLLEHGANVNARTEMNATPLHWAAITNATHVAEILIDNGADVNAKSTNGITPLHLAAWHDRIEIARLLVAHNADHRAKTDDGRIPIQGALANKSMTTAFFLLELEE